MVNPQPHVSQHSRFGVYVVAALIVTLFLHTWRLGALPRGFYTDECAFAYNGYSLAHTGADEYGTAWPLFFRSFDTWADPVAIYSAAPFMAAFGLEQWAARLPSVMFVLLAGAAFGWLLYCWGFGKGWALLGGWVLTLLPWTFVISRNGSFAGHLAALAGLAAGLGCQWRAFRRRSWRWAALAGAAWAFTIYSQNSARLTILLFLLAALFWLGRWAWQRWKICLVTITVMTVLLTPMFVVAVQRPETLTARFSRVGLPRVSASTGEVLDGFVSRYFEYFRPDFLWQRGDANLRHHTGKTGELYWCLTPLVLAGLWVALQQWRWPAYGVVLAGLAVAPVSAALTIDHAHSTRAVYGVIFWLILAIIGARWWRRRAWGQAVLAGVCLLGLSESTRYFRDYFGAYQQRSASSYQTGLNDALRYCFGELKPGETLNVSSWTFDYDGIHPDENLKPFYYAHFLFFGKIDPREYQFNGLPKQRVRLYRPPLANPGLLLTSRNVATTPDKAWVLGPKISLETDAVLVPNSEPLPASASLIRSFPVGGEDVLDVYRVQ